MDDFKFYSKYLIVEGKPFNYEIFISQFKEKYLRLTENGTLHEIKIEYVKDYIKIYIEYGNPMPHPDHVLNAKISKEQSNPRSEDQIEPKQMFIVIDSMNSRVWVSNIRKSSILITLFGKYNLKAEIKNLYNSDDFIAKIKSVNGIRLTSTPESLFKLTDFNKVLDHDVYGYGAKSATLSLNYNGIKKLDKKVLKNISNLFNQRASFDSFMISGKDDGNMDVVFNNESLVEKIFLNIKPIKNGEFDKEEVFSKILERIKQ